MKVIDFSKYNGIEFLEIQKQIITENKEKFGIFLGTGVGKTLTALCLAEGRILVIAPKQQMLDKTWQKNAEKFELDKDLTVINYDMFWRKPELWEQYDTVILDEGHRALGVLPETRQRNKIPIPKTSKTFEAILVYLNKFPPTRFYVCTATPMSKPMNVWALAKLFGKHWDFYKFRQTFYFPTMMGRRQVWLPRLDEASRNRLAEAVKKLGYTGSLIDFMDVPEQTHLTVEIELTDEQDEALRELALEEADPLVRRSQMRTIENGIRYVKRIDSVDEKFDMMLKDTKYYKNNKIEYILDRAQEFKKLFIFTAYRAQTEAIARRLAYEGYTVQSVFGDTEDRANVFENFDKLEYGIIVVQAQICEGYRVPSAPCMIFASKANRYVMYEQGIGRIMDSQHLKKNLFIHLVVPDGADEACHEAIMSGVDFAEKLSIL